MNNINTIDRVTYTPAKSNKWKNFGYGVMLLSLLNFSSPANAQNTNSSNNNTNDVELNMSKTNRYSLSPVYKTKIENILKGNLPMVDIDGTSSQMFTIDFVLKEMESDRGISKDNQLLFIWNSICKQLTGKYVYNGDDGDSKRLDEIGATIDKWESCGRRYREGIMPFIKKQSDEYDKRIADSQKRSAEYDRQIAQNEQQIAQNKQQIAEYDKQIAEYDKQIAEYDKQIAEYEQRSADAQQKSADAIKSGMSADTLGINEMLKCYNLYIENPNTSNKNAIENVKNVAKDIVKSCREYGIDYKAILLKEVGNRRKVDEMLEFYGVE